MFRFVLMSALLATVTCQYNSNPRTAAIISEQRYLSGDGKFGAAYTQEDGINFKEETDADGTRHGQYSYIDPNGQKRTISYTAGKFGFQASGDHLPVAPPAPPQPIPTPGYQPDPRYQPQAAPHNQQQAYSGDYNSAEGQYDPRHNDPDWEGNRIPGGHAAAQPLAQYQYSTAAPQYNNYQPTQPQYNHYQPTQPQYQAQYETTPNPNRFLPPGKLQLNRTPDGFSYSFNKL